MVDRTMDAAADEIDARRIVRIVALTFVITTVVVFLAVFGLYAGFDVQDRFDSVAQTVAVIIGFPLTFGCFAASLACIVLSWSAIMQATAALGKDRSVRRRIGRSVKTGTSEGLTADEAWSAARYSVFAAAYLPVQIAQFAFLFGGVFVQQVTSLVTTPISIFRELTPWIIGLLVVTYFWSVYQLVRQLRRTRRYAAAHADVVLAGPPVD